LLFNQNNINFFFSYKKYFFFFFFKIKLKKKKNSLPFRPSLRQMAFQVPLDS
jgi:hypothetical protein